MARRRKPGKSHHRHGAFGETAAERRELKAREEAAFMRRARLSKRDQDYARSPYAPRVTVEERDLRNSEFGQIMRTEWRDSAASAATPSTMSATAKPET